VIINILGMPIDPTGFVTMELIWKYGSLLVTLNGKVLFGLGGSPWGIERSLKY
jgi:hypothetical protein